MPDNTEKSIPGSENSTYLPDFCDGDVFLRLLLVVQLIAIMFALVSFGGGRLFVHLALISLAMLWVGLTTAALLCLMNRQGWLGDHARTTMLVFAAAILMTLLVSFLSLGLGGVMSYGPTASDAIYTLARNLSIVVILVGLALRYFYLRHESDLRLKGLEKEFGDRFYRIHRNALVSLAWLAGMQSDNNGHQVTFRDIDDCLEVGRRHLPGVRKIIKNL